jgi:hypothetical protein
MESALHMECAAKLFSVEFSSRKESKKRNTWKKRLFFCSRLQVKRPGSETCFSHMRNFKILNNDFHVDLKRHYLAVTLYTIPSIARKRRHLMEGRNPRELICLRFCDLSLHRRVNCSPARGRILTNCVSTRAVRNSDRRCMKEQLLRTPGKSVIVTMPNRNGFMKNVMKILNQLLDIHTTRVNSRWKIP